MTNQPPLAELLRAATREQHQQLDRHPLLRPLIQPGIRAEQYSAALAALHGPTAELERQVEPLFQGQSGPGYSPRIRLLAQDLARLHGQPRPYQGPLLKLHNPAQQIGGLYVLEGSRMGAFAIAQRLEQDLPDLPRDFFGNGGRRGWPDYWPPLLASLDPSQYPDAIQGAQQAFEAFIQHLSACH
ncbi:biliverdin-producing heme oxygenase [Magnetovirga frankeli]|uniref:biliverdin-producing heme oxygenase n=1 Tax=Magnetovirga frankeli TaxID=947516 RepID=UPI001293CC8A|nr:biliverdin-producing heme oxygenase [gamma proteobacterium SS-5]